MDMDLASADTRIAENRTRVARAERYGPLLSTRGASNASRRTSTGAVAVIANALRTIGTAMGSIGGLAHDSRDALRSREHDLAALGMRWQADPAYDGELAAEAKAAHKRRVAGPAISPAAPGRVARGHGSATGKPRRSDGGALARAGGGLRVSARPAAVGGGGQGGD